MVTETELETNVVHIEKKIEDITRDEMNDHEHLDRIKEEDENAGDDRKGEEIIEDENKLNAANINERMINGTHDKRPASEIKSEHENNDSNEINETTDEQADNNDDSELETERRKEDVKIDDIPLINKSDLIVINVTSSNPLIADASKRKSTEVLNGSVPAKIDKIELVATKPVTEKEVTNEETNGEKSISFIDNETLETDESLNVNSRESKENDNTEKTEQKIEINDEAQIEMDNKEKTDEKSNKQKKLSFWSKVWKSSTNEKPMNKNTDENNHETFKSTDTSIEIIDSPINGEKKNGSVETTETMEITMVSNEIADIKKPNDQEENMIPTHLFFRVKSPYLKYVFSCTIFVILLLLCASIVILFPSTFDIKYLTKQFINLYNHNETKITIVPIVETNCGQFKGSMEGNTAIFRGIPYAKAPIGKRRWMPAEEVNCNRSQLNEAFYMRDFCFQKPLDKFNLTFSEDCLYLNIWVPNWKKKSFEKEIVNNTESEKTGQLPVFIYLSGDMTTGFTSMDMEWLPEGLEIANDYNSIFVTLNYRFGVFGFLSLDILHKRSKQILNYGLSDIVSALRWINQNIEFFGGDPEQITLLSHGSSATLALAAATNEDSSQYLTRVWLATPAPSFVNISKQRSFELNNQFIHNVGCQPNITSIVRITDLEEQVTNCLLKISPETAINATPLNWYETFSDLPSNKIEMTRSPILIIDGHTIKMNPYEILDTTNVEIVFGMNIEESGAFSKLPNQLESWEHSNFTKIIQTELSAISSVITEEVIEQYLNDKEFVSNEQTYHRLVTEIRFICPLFRSIENVTNTENIYLYLNKYKPSYPISYVNDHSESPMTVHGIDIIALLDLLTNWFVLNPNENDLTYKKTIKNEFKSFLHSMYNFNFKNLTNNQINIITNDGKLTTTSIPIHNCHRFWSAFNQFAKVN